MKKILIISLILAALVTVLGCQTINTSTVVTGKKSIVVTYSILGSIVKDLVGENANVTVSIPNGLDPHEWEPSARDIETINKADLVIQNGLGLEGGLEKTLEAAKNSGVKFFTATDYITVRHVGQGEGIPSGDPDQVIGAPDPHFWMSPVAMRNVVGALSTELLRDFNMDVSSQAASLENRLEALDISIADTVAIIPQADRKLVTGHESMGYFAQLYNFKLLGVIIPSLSSQAGVTAADLATLKKTITENQVKVIFSELGTSPAVAKTIGDETGAKVVELSTHSLPPDGSYFTFLSNISSTIVNALK